MDAVRQSGFCVLEGRQKRKDGSTVPVEVSVRYVTLDRDYLNAVRDITERKAAEKALKHSNEQLPTSVPIESGVSPVPRPPPHSGTRARVSTATEGAQSQVYPCLTQLWHRSDIQGDLFAQLVRRIELALIPQLFSQLNLQFLTVKLIIKAQ